jgi:acyl carrier protein
MNRSHALTSVRTVLADELGLPAEEITPAANLREDLGMDSLDLVELVTSLEEQVGQRVPREQLEGVHTIDDVVDLVLILAELDAPGQRAA